MRYSAIVFSLICATAWGAQAADPVNLRLVVYFPEWSVAMNDNAQKVVAQAVQVARENPDAVIQVRGFADVTGTARSNALLSELRAQRVADVMVEAGVPVGSIKIYGKGSVESQFTTQEARRVVIGIRTK
jgi:outer membrane protein OmpA-like peptidoglycan-associated protein